MLNWWMEPERRLRRAMLKSLGRPAETEALSPLEGKAAGLDFSGGQIAVLWSNGADGLVFAFDEVEGAEMIVDGHVVARVRRGETRKSLDVMAPEASEVTLRLMFLDPRWPEFELALWNSGTATQTVGSAASPPEALRLGRRWLSHVEALLR
jgi:hypothetical protein